MKYFKHTSCKDDLRALVLIFCAKMTFTISESDVQYLLSKKKLSNLEILQREISRLNDYQVIQRILSGMENFAMAESEKENLILEIKELFQFQGEINATRMNWLKSFGQLIKL